MNKNFFDLARKISKLSNHHKHKMGCVLVYKNKPISFGVNQLKTHTRSPHKFKMVHAEFHAILNSKLDNFKDCSIYIFRETPGGRMAKAFPCSSCLQMLKTLDIKEVYYTDDNGFKSTII